MGPPRATLRRHARALPAALALACACAPVLASAAAPAPLVLQLGPGEHRRSLGRLDGATVTGAGAGVTIVRVPEGEDGLVATGEVTLSGLSIVAGPHRSALKVLGGSVRLDDVALVGGAAGAYLDEGRLEGRGVVLHGGYGLLSARGEVRLRDVTASGVSAGVAQLRGSLTLERAAITGPSVEAGLSLAGGTAHLSAVVIRRPGPTGLAVSRATLDGQDVSVHGARTTQGFLGDCLQVRRGEVRLSSSELTGCGGAAVEASSSTVRLEGVDAAGGEAGCLVFTEGARADLAFTRCGGRGPGLVVAEGASVRAFGARFLAEPAIWADCAGGARVELLGQPGARQPCPSPP